MSAILLHEYIERLSHLLRSKNRLEGVGFDLQPIQLGALHFLSHSNRYSNTPQAVTEYFGLTKGTVSQTLKVLERKGLVKKSPDPKDGRVVHLKVTRAGQKILEKTFPAATVTKGWEGMLESQQGQLLEGLQQLLLSMQKLNGMKLFGVCRTCRYNRTKDEDKFFCELTQENLSLSDVKLICREYQLPEVTENVKS